MNHQIERRGASPESEDALSPEILALLGSLQPSLQASS
jgi:hypothetical protein